MKARVKKTGKIVDVYEWSTLTTVSGDNYELEDVELIIDGENYIPDYWTKLEHQYAGMAMQGILAKYGMEPLPDDLINDACEYARALVEKMKEEE